MQNPGFERQDNAFIRRLSKIVVENFSNEQFSVEQLSSEMGLSRSQLYRRLKQINGLTISQFIRQVRLEEAKKLLLSDTAVISEIAYLVGFNSPAYFHKCFQEYFGQTPGNMKKTAASGGMVEDDEPSDPNHAGSTTASSEKKLQPQKPSPQTNGFSRPGWQSKRWSLILFPIIAFAVVGLLAQFLEKEHKGYHILAVLPMEYLPASLEQEYWVKALEEAFREELERLPTVRVLSKASTVGIVERNMLLPEMAEQLQVDAIIEGSVLKSGDRVWLRMNLIKTHPVEQQIWAGEFLELLEEIKSRQEPLVRHIAREIKLSFAAMTGEN